MRPLSDIFSAGSGARFTLDGVRVTSSPPAYGIGSLDRSGLIKPDGLGSTRSVWWTLARGCPLGRPRVAIAVPGQGGCLR